MITDPGASSSVLTSWDTTPSRPWYIRRRARMSLPDSSTGCSGGKFMWKLRCSCPRLNLPVSSSRSLT